VVGKPPLIQPIDLPLRGPRHAVAAAAETVAEMEKHHFSSVLERTDWNITHAAEVLQVDRATVYNKIKKYDLHR
jgi:transcriptional regulator of acetoin/glycerol metabolism